MLYAISFGNIVLCLVSMSIIVGDCLNICIVSLSVMLYCFVFVRWVEYGMNFFLSLGWFVSVRSIWCAIGIAAMIAVHCSHLVWFGSRLFGFW